MARRPPIAEEATPPEQFAASPPRDLHATSDIRFVMVEIAKLTTVVERLCEDVKDQGQKIDELRHQATYIKGGLAVAVITLGVCGWLLNQIIDGKLQAIAAAIATIHK